MDNDLTDFNIKWIKPLRKDRLFTIIYNTYQLQNDKTFRLVPNKETILAELWDWARQISSLPSEKQTCTSLICHLRKNIQGIVHALKTDFPELQIKEYYEPIPKYDENVILLFQVVKVNSAIVKAEEILAITNATIVNYETAEFLENKLKKTLEEICSLDRHHIADCYGILPELLTEKFILKICISARDIDNRVKYKADNVKMCIDSPKVISYLQDLVFRMARVFDNTDALCRAKKSGLKTIRAKLGLLNSALYAIYELKFKAIDKNARYYYLVSSFDDEDAPKLPLYQTREEIYWVNEKDTRYGYSKLLLDEILI
ncbi:16712_t:CDS:2 [Cetraspora pellucida]|uniref:16712_t:CDS:1 n=1 Tax=Cetraspora pellucida TaxID=1433469 RepID=A0A9N9GVA5_9GLOM|nr:16712_t:CDS:2 [Cetraspora pellucida]